MVERVPDELWEMVGQALIDSAVERARLAVLSMLAPGCDCCLGDRQYALAAELAAEASCWDDSDGYESDESSRSDRSIGSVFYNTAIDYIADERSAYHKAHVWDTNWILYSDDENDDEPDDDELAQMRWEDWAVDTLTDGLSSKVCMPC